MFSERTTLQRLLLLKALSGGGQSLVERTALGNPLTFGTDVSKALKSLLIPFTPQQEGTGDPSPSNIRSILPWYGLSVFGGGKNLFNNSDGIELTANMICFARTRGYGVPFSMKKGFTYTVSINSRERNPSEWQIQKPFTGVSIKTVYGGTKITYTPDEDVEVAVMAYWQSGGRPEAVTDFQIEIGSSATAYEPYKPITDTDIVFPSPVYGGEHEAVSGRLTDAFKSVDLGSKSWSLRGENQNRQVWECFCNDAKFYAVGSDETANALSSQFSLTTRSGAWSVGKFAPSTAGNNKVFIFVVPAGSYASASECKAAMAGIQLCYELIDSAKQEIQLTPAQLTALVGNNTIWSDADGSMTAVYLVSSKYAEEHPVGGLGSGLGSGFGSGLLGSGTEDNPEDPAEDPAEDPEEEIPDNTEEGSETDD